MREEHPCATWAKTGTECTTCERQGTGACAGIELRRRAALADLEAKLSKLERGYHQIFTLQEEKLLLEAWRALHPRQTPTVTRTKVSA